LGKEVCGWARIATQAAVHPLALDSHLRELCLHILFCVDAELN
jgi:hypothetical protein